MGRKDPVEAVRFELQAKRGPARAVFRALMALALDDDVAKKNETAAGSVERTVQRIHKQLIAHPGASLKREAIRDLLK